MDIIKKYVDSFNADDEQIYANLVDNEHAYEWMKEEIPVFECPDKDIERAYYFRWWTFRKHLKLTEDGYVFTEFLPKVGWSGKHNTINAAVGHHIYEGRWLKNSGKYLGDYIRFFLSEKEQSHKYSAWMIYAALQMCKITGNYDLGDDFLSKICEYYDYWEETHGADRDKFWSYDGRDAMEFSISGTLPNKVSRKGIRPTLNSYMCADAYAIAEFARMAGKNDIAQKYTEKYEALKSMINSKLWENGFYRAFHYFDGEDIGKLFEAHKNESPRELIGYIPWMFSIPPVGRESVFDLLIDENSFHSKYGLMSAERSHERFLYEVNHECLWNGYVWPYATSQTLTAMYNMIREYPDTEKYKDMYCRLLRQYACSHTLTKEDGRVVSWIDEVRHPLRDEWSSRSILRDDGWKPGRGGYERGKDYNHSTFCDLVISGIVGVHGDNELKLSPNIPSDWEWFKLSNLHFNGGVYTIEYNKANGITVNA
ncbi:MAG: hypothetical protein IJ391_04155 [Clostridia bacterium]|nr:hypothetical protein [Clostridia bacterium]